MTKRRLDSSKMAVPRIIATESALNLLSELHQQHGALLFHQSGGCCDGSAPMCFPEDEFLIDSNDVFIGEIDKVPFYMAADQFEYWKHTQLTLDITPGRGSSFSLEAPTGNRFMIRSKLFTEEEMKHLTPIRKGA